MFDTLRYHRSNAYKATQKTLEEALTPQEYALVKKGNRKMFWKDTIVDSGVCGAVLVVAFCAGYVTRLNELHKEQVNEDPNA